MKFLRALTVTAMAMLAACASSAPKKADPSRNKTPLTEEDLEAQKKARALTEWEAIRKQMGKGWFEKSESATWNGHTVFGAGVSRYNRRPAEPASSGVLEVRGPFFLATSGSYLIWSTLKTATLKLDGADHIDAVGAQYAANPFGAGEAYSKSYPWNAFLKAPAAAPAPTPSPPKP